MFEHYVLVVEAVQVTNSNAEEIAMEDSMNMFALTDGRLYVRTPLGELVVREGEWIVRLEERVYYVLDDNSFLERFAKVVSRKFERLEEDERTGNFKN